MATASSQRQQQEERRKQKLAEIDEQVRSGRLTVRKMTAEERKRHDALRREPKPKPKRR
jgi:hypothetical protein